MMIKATLEDVISVFSKLKEPTNPIWNRIYDEVAKSLRNTLKQDVFTQHNDVVTISSKDKLRELISNSPNHNPPRDGNEIPPDYNEDYLALKYRLGEDMPHKFREYGFWNGINISSDGGKLEMKITPSPDSFHSFKGHGLTSYLEIHEKTRSVLKLAFLRGWGPLISSIIKKLANEIKKK